MATNNTFISFYMKKYTFRISTRAIRVLDNPVYVRFLINPDKNLMAMESYDKIELTSFRIRRSILEDSKYHSFKIASKKLCTLLARRMNWKTDRSYRIPGKIHPEKKIVIYRLEEAKEIPEKAVKNNDGTIQEQSVL